MKSGWYAHETNMSPDSFDSLRDKPAKTPNEGFRRLILFTTIACI